MVGLRVVEDLCPCIQRSVLGVSGERPDEKSRLSLSERMEHGRGGSEVDATAAQIALAWLLAQGDDIAPIPGTKRVCRVEENTAADGIELSAEQIARLNELTPATGERHDEANMSIIDR